jgi:hypothetical protein
LWGNKIAWLCSHAQKPTIIGRHRVPTLRGSSSKLELTTCTKADGRQERRPDLWGSKLAWLCSHAQKPTIIGMHRVPTLRPSSSELELTTCTKPGNTREPGTNRVMNQTCLMLFQGTKTRQIR